MKDRSAKSIKSKMERILKPEKKKSSEKYRN